MTLPNSSSPEFGAQIARLLDTNLDIKTRLSIASDIKDAYDSYRDAADVSRLIITAIPVLVDALRRGPPVLKKDLPEHQLRMTMLTTLHRLPHNESMRQFAVNLMSLMVHLLRTDNEEMGVLCVKVIIDLNRTYKAQLDGHVQPFIEVVQDMYGNMEAVVKETFRADAPSPPPPAAVSVGSIGTGSENDDRPMALSLQSFKVLIECPIASVIFNNYYRLLIAPSIKFVRLQVEQQQQAHEESAKHHSLWIGVSANIRNRIAYTEFITAQSKAMSFIAYVFRAGLGEQLLRQYDDVIPPVCIRLLQDCPSEASSVRKELLVAIRHVLSAEPRNLFLSQIDHLLDERVLVGTGAASAEVLRPLAYSVLADLVHHIRNDLSAAQLSRVIHAYSCNLHTPSITCGVQTMCMKLLVTLVECVINKCTRPEAARILSGLLETAVDKLGALHRMHQDLVSIAEAAKEQKEKEKEEGNSNSPPKVPTFVMVERSKPTQGVSYVAEQPEEVIKEARLLFRTLLHGFKTILAGLREVEGPTPDGEIMSRLFEGGLRCLVFYERYGDPRDEKEILERFGEVFQEMQPHVFQEVWTLKLPFFIEHMLVHNNVMALPQILLASDTLSRQLVSIMLRHLVGTLDTLGDQDLKNAAATLRLFKMSFMAVTLLPELNEDALLPHLPRLIVDSFPLAGQAAEPTHYFLLLRALFRAIGGGKFELIYQEVLPLLQDMLDNLDRILLAVEPSKRDLLVELCLTVPVRLTHLLPHLSYLMKPLVFALRAGPELVAQGLRTLELCIDNLTPEFLDPVLSPVLRDLMGALHNILRPLPAPHTSAHTTIRILGKLGGRNRRLQHEPPMLTFQQATDEVGLPLTFEGRSETLVDVSAVCALAAKTIRHQNPVYRAHAFEVLRSTFAVLYNKKPTGAVVGARGREHETAFTTVVEGLIDAIHVADFKPYAMQFMRDISRALFTSESGTTLSTPLSRRPPLAPTVSLHINTLPYALAVSDPQELKEAQEMLSFIVGDLALVLRGQASSDDVKRNVSSILHFLANRFVCMCFEATMTKKMAGFHGIVIMTGTVDLGIQWINDRELDFVRALLTVLKDMPGEPPRDVDQIIGAIIQILRVCNETPPPPPPAVPESADGVTPSAGPPNLPPLRTKITYLAGIMAAELSSANPIVRQATQQCIKLLGELSGKTLTELMLPHRDRLFAPIYTKPLRALPLQNQIGHIDAVTYTLNMRPPLPDVTEELLRLLNETLALADADDAHFLLRGTAQRQASVMVTKLRVACIKLLTASMPVTDFFAKQGQTRQRVTSVYFKSLYSPSSDVKHAAHEGLRIVLSHQSRLPKELLQTGLRPILMNLADPKRLTVANLEGLSRLLELLTNYFKVEVGSKLMDHYRVLADANMLRKAAYGPLADNEEILKLVRLAHIFHLLPHPGASIFLEDLAALIVETETQLHAAAPSPFTEPLALFIDKYPVEAVDYLFNNIAQPRHVRTLRNVLISKRAPAFDAELRKQVPRLVETCLRDSALAMPGLLICSDLVSLDPEWFLDQNLILETLLDIWRNEFKPDPAISYQPPTVRVRQPAIMLSIFMSCLEHSDRLDVLFGIIAIYTRRIAMDLSALTRFLHQRIAMHSSLDFKRQVLRRFLLWFDEPTPPWPHITQFLRIVVSPMILCSYTSKDTPEALMDVEMIGLFHEKIWSPMASFATNNTFQGGPPEDTLKIELMHMSGLLIHHCPDLMHEARKDVIKFAWLSVTSDDAIVKQTSNVLIARFFEAYDSPAKLIFRVWTGLLRPQQQIEGRLLIRTAIDILAPALPKRIPADANTPSWAKVTRRFLTEDGPGLSQLLLIYQIIMRHYELFFPHREMFVPHIVTSLIKLGLPPGATPDTRIVSMDLVDLVLKWERMQASLLAGAADSAPPSKTGDQPLRPTSWTMPSPLRESCVSYLVRFVVMAEMSWKGAPLPRALRLLRDLLNLPGWQETMIKPQFFDRALVQPELTDQSLNVFANSIRLLSIYVEDKPEQWWIENVGQLRQWLEKGLTSNEPILHELCSPVLDRLISSLPAQVDEDEPQGPAQAFHLFVNTIIGEGLRGGTHLPLVLTVLLSVVRKRPKTLEEFAPNLMKIFTKYCRDHLHAIQAKTSTDPTARLLKIILEVCRVQVPSSLEPRKALINGVLLLVDKSTDSTICRLILDICREWVFVRTEGLPSMKEKASILQKMTSFEGKKGDEALFTDYLGLIYDIYKAPSLHRTDLTTRLEPAFLLGCRYKDPVIRAKFTTLFDESLPRSLTARLQYVLGSQSWEYLAEHNWIAQALELLLGAVNEGEILAPAFDANAMDVDGVPGTQAPFGSQAITVGNFIRPMRHLLHLEPAVTHRMWISIFGAIWRLLSRKEQTDATRFLILLLGKEYHSKQSSLPHNVIQSLLEGALACQPPIGLPPYVVKYLGKNFNAWHTSLEILQNSLDHVRDEENIRESTLDALAELYAELSEDDMFYGLWRRRALYPETNVALSFEQNGLWPQAQMMYETAQQRARHGNIPFSESEYCLWEDHWILAAQKLQQWDILTDFAKNENNYDLLLECAWVLSDWSADREMIERTIEAVSDIGTPRRRVFEAFTALIRINRGATRDDFVRALEDAMQLSLRKWVSLPSIVSMVHVPLLQHFQQFVELQEAAQIFHALALTNSQNLERRSGELKVVLQAWRERLPNLWDDISVWSDLVAWRQHIFSAINKAYIPLIQNPAPNSGTGGNHNTSGYRGYHETAWIINRFAHVARKHQLYEACHSSLTRIYTLPNIEISEAFLKLREQARCHYQNPNELAAGLEVINNTNLMYFSAPQKAEFYTLKGMFIAKLGHNEDANAAFGQAVQMDLNMPKAWAEWGRYNDRMFKESPTDMSLAGNAVSCYLQASGLHKNSKTRPLLIRVLWLLSLDDSTGTISRAFEGYKGDVALWYWITLIPQLLLSLAHREARHARQLLMNLAKTYPQALFFQLRTTRDDYAPGRKQQQAAAAAAAAKIEAATQPLTQTPGATSTSETQTPETTNDDPSKLPPKDVKPGTPSVQTPLGAPSTPQPEGIQGRPIRHPWEYVDEIVAILKTAFPLLSLTMETLVDQVVQRFKPSSEEELYRFLSALISEGISHYALRTGSYTEDGTVPPSCSQNLARFINNLPPESRPVYEDDLVNSKPTMQQYLRKLQVWRNRYEAHLELRPKKQPLDLLSHWLVEFQHAKFDEIEVPGQYLEHKDGSANFVRIARFSPQFELCQGNGYCYRRITLLGHDGTSHSFAVQFPAARYCRREERMMQLFRIFNGVLSRRKESRKRNLMFHLPVAIPFTPSLRLLENDASIVTLQDIYNQHCQAIGASTEDAVLAFLDKLSSVLDPAHPITPTELVNLRMELFDEMASKLIPKTILTNYMIRTMAGPIELWMMRKQFTLQVAAVSFTSYIMSSTGRAPSRFHLSRSSGLIYSSEFLPSFSHNQVKLENTEKVPFRFTPNMQHFITPNGMEGLMTSGIMAIGRCLTEPEYDLDQQLSLFLRDEVLTWYHAHHKMTTSDLTVRMNVAQNVDIVVKRAEILACKFETDNFEQTHANSPIPAVLAVTNLISNATNPQNLAQMPEQWHPCF